eukprot:1890224-Pleurochrysis_carterae.AAC.5
MKPTTKFSLPHLVCSLSARHVLSAWHVNRAPAITEHPCIWFCSGRDVLGNLIREPKRFDGNTILRCSHGSQAMWGLRVGGSIEKTM